jgi:predicted DNA binding protein
MFAGTYPSADLQAKRDYERSRRTVSQARAALTEDLTDRQLEALQTAYVSGYFEQPRCHTASEIAETMGISQQTFDAHLRTAHRKLCRELFDAAPVRG